ncbi:MAG: tRNA glutamyl-Q(34) synthetase GluQRS [Boseongicola sp.]|nr:tRNA glutamyl-Q(34) synthetase GluQRS [Boseongicola sp.]
MPFRTRFAPSPTGPLHLGHAYSAILAHDMARERNGEFLLRIEDIDQSRARAEWEELIYEDLVWLGLTWDGDVLRQSTRMPIYHRALQILWDEDLIFACNCSRRDINEALSAPHEGTPPSGPDGVIYPGTCRRHGKANGTASLPENTALRLDMEKVVRRLRKQPALEYIETGSVLAAAGKAQQIQLQELPSTVGDIVVARKDMGTSYHLSVVLDDADQAVTHVVRGQDLEEATAIHVVLQSLLGLPTPIYHHHRLIRDKTGKRLAKRDDARAIRTYRQDGASPEDIRHMVGL